MSNGSPTATPLPAGWELAELAKVARINPPLDCPDPGDEDDVNFVPMRAVEPEGGGLLRPEIRSYGEVKKGYTAFQCGDVIMAKITPCMENGKTAVVPELPGAVCFGSTEFHVLRTESGISPKWLANFLLQHEVRRAAQRKMTGGVGQMRVPASFLEDAVIPVAPSAEQRRITDAVDELLSDLDAGVTALDRVRKMLAHYRAAVLKAAVEGSLTEDWRQQHVSTESASALLTGILVTRRKRWEEHQLKRFAATGKHPPSNWTLKYKEPVAPDTALLPKLGKGWCWASFDQIGETQGGLQKSPSRKPVKNHYPYLRVANVHRAHLDLRELHRFELTEQELERLRLYPGDLLIVEGNGSLSEIGRCAIWAGEIDDCVHQNHIIRVRPFSGVIPKYIDLFLNSPLGQKAIQKVASSTSGLYTLSVTKIEKLSIPIPPTAEQEAIIEAVEDHLSIVEHLAADLETQMKTEQSLRQAILRYSFTGRLAPQDPHDEPASALLKRIAVTRDEHAAQKARANNMSKRPSVRRKAALAKE